MDIIEFVLPEVYNDVCLAIKACTTTENNCKVIRETERTGGYNTLSMDNFIGLELNAIISILNQIYCDMYNSVSFIMYFIKY